MTVTVHATDSRAAPDAAPLVVRRARASDDAGCRSLLASVAMEADLALSVRRRPTVEAMYALHARAWEQWVASGAGSETDAEIAAMASVLVRDGYVDGAVAPVGYLGDLRFSPRAEGRQILDRQYGPILSAAAARFGCRHFLTTIIASNARARRALTVQTARAARRGRPTYTLVREFDIRSIHLVLPRRRERSDYVVRRARDSDIPVIAALLDADARRRPLGYPMPEAELRRRLATWPGLQIDSFLLACRADGTVAGVMAPWDSAPVKQTVVDAYRGAMRRVRTLHDLAARLLGRPRLPAPGQPLHYRYLTHVAVPPGEPAVLRALLAAAYQAARRQGYHFLSVPAPVGDPLDVAYRGYLTTDIRAGLYAVTLPGTQVPAWLAEGPMPGFEMALV